MRCTPSEHPILVTEPTWNTQANRERMAEIMFEEFQVPAFYIANTGVLNAYVAFLLKQHRRLSISTDLQLERVQLLSLTSASLWQV